VQLLSRKAQHLVLTGPFGSRVSKSVEQTGKAIRNPTRHARRLSP
jgi:hypothetical protein